MGKQKSDKIKKEFTTPRLEIFQIDCNDIIVTSGSIDENQGEWDPQYYMSIENYR